MGLMLAEPGFHTRCWVEWEEYPRSVIVAAQRAGYFAPAPIWDDLTTFDARPFAGAIDTVLAGYPCQPFSHAGQRKGADDERHLWPDVARVARELGPSLKWVFLENVAGHVTLGLETVLRDLRDMGFTPAVGLFTAAETGAPHERERVFIVAHRQGPDGRSEQQAGRTRSGGARPSGSGAELGNTNSGDDARGMDSGATGREAGRSQASHEGSRRSSDGERFRPESGGSGIDMEHATGLDGRIHARSRREGGRTADAGGTGGTMADTSRGRHGGSRQGEVEQPGRAEAERSSCNLADTDGRDASTEGLQRSGEQRLYPEGGRFGGRGNGVSVADTGCNTGHQGRASVGGSGYGPRSAGQAIGLGGSRPYVHPPGPADMGRWADVLSVAPYLAPSLSISDVKRAADHFAQMVARGELAETQAQSFVRLCADGMANRSRALRLLGNGVHCLAAGHAWRTLSAAHGLRPLDLASARDGDGAGADEFDMRAAE